MQLSAVEVEAVAAPLKEGARDAVIQLLGAEPFKPALWDWQFVERGKEAGFFGVAGRNAAGSIVAFNGVMPVSVRIAGRVTEAAWSCDFVVDPAYRGQGVGKQLKKLLQSRYACVLALGISDPAASVHAAMQWTSPTTCKGYTRIRGGRHFKARVKQALQSVVKSALVVARLGTARGNITVQPVSECVQELAQLWQDVEEQYPFAVRRTAEYLNWRYARHPLAKYEAIVLHRANRPIAAAVFWRAGSRAALVDYIGPRSAFGIKLTLVRAFAAFVRRCAAVSCTTSDSQLGRALSVHGFLGLVGGGLRFNTYLENSSNHPGDQNWFLMGGDSDGDILTAARAFATSKVEQVDRLDDQHLRSLWTRLHSEASDLDRLFTSWEWQSAWWGTFAPINRLKLKALMLRCRETGRAGIAPLYASEGRGFGLKTRRLQLIGNIWRGPATMRSEYLDFVSPQHCRGAVVRAFLDEIEKMDDWDEFVLPDLDCGSATLAAIKSHRLAQTCSFRSLDEDVGYHVDTSQGFNVFLASLPSSARRRIFLQRSKLEAMGQVSIDIGEGERFAEMAARLDRLHRMRWGTAFFTDAMLAFHRRVLENMAHAAEGRISVLMLNGQDVSALYNIRTARVEYNLQGGFNARIVPGVSIGTLHLGYAIEDACAAGMESFELLIGKGKYREFKKDFAVPSRRVRTLHIVRNRVLANLYRGRDLAKTLRRALGPALSAASAPVQHE